MRRNGLGGLAPWAVVLVVESAGCEAHYRDPASRPLSTTDARTLAAELANQECKARFSQTPFHESSFAIEYRNGRWFWGSVDPYGVHGFSAEVSFDSTGANRVVEVFYSTDHSAIRIRDSEEPRDE